MRRVVVTGLGMVSPLGGDLETSWRNILASKSGAARMALWPKVFPPSPASKRLTQPGLPAMSVIVSTSRSIPPSRIDSGIR